jgi:hypothetical protein
MTRIALTLAAFTALASAAPAAAQYASRYDSYAAADVDIQGLGAEIDAAAARGEISSRDATGLRSQLRGLVNLQRQYEANGLSSSERTDLQQRAQGLRNEIAEAGGSASGDSYGTDRYGTEGYANDRGYADRGTYGTTRAPGYQGTYGNGYGRQGYSGGTYSNTYQTPGYNGGTYGNTYGTPGYSGGTYVNTYGAPGSNAGSYGNGYGTPSYNGGTYGNGYANRGYAGNQYGQYDRNQAYRDDNRDDGYDDEDGVVLRVGDRAPGGLYGVPDEYRARFRDSPYFYYRYGAGNIYQIDARNGSVTRVIRVDR